MNGPMNVLHVASEVAPLSVLASSGNGAMVQAVSALPRALARLPDVRAQVISGRHGSISAEELARFALARRLRTVPVELAGSRHEVAVYEGRLPQGGSQVPLYLIDHPLLSGRRLYGDQPERDYPDNPQRFALLCKAAVAVAVAFGLRPDVLHAHDWPGALALYYARQGGGAAARATVLSLHDLAALGRGRGLFALPQARELGIAEEHWNPEGIEFYGRGSLLKAGILHADRVVAPGPRYAREIQTEDLGAGLQGLFGRLAGEGRLSGILDGADDEGFSPWADPYLPAPYGRPAGGDDAADTGEGPALAGKARCKAELQRELGLGQRPRVPLCVACTALSTDAGIDLLLSVLEAEELWRGDMHFAILAAADGGGLAYGERLLGLLRRYRGRMALRTPDEALLHRALAGADLVVSPVRHEPSAKLPMYALRYGAIPVARSVGAVADRVVDYDPHSRSGTGFLFSTWDARALQHAWQRALSAYCGDEAAWQALVRRALRVDRSWDTAARAYLSLYRQVLWGRA